MFSPSYSSPVNHEPIGCISPYPVHKLKSNSEMYSSLINNQPLLSIETRVFWMKEESQKKEVSWKINISALDLVFSKMIMKKFSWA